MSDEKRCPDCAVAPGEKRAADLPVGAVVATEHAAWIKTATADSHDTGVGWWLPTGDELTTFDDIVQEAIDDGAVVLRAGDGRNQ